MRPIRGSSDGPLNGLADAMAHVCPNRRTGVRRVLLICYKVAITRLRAIAGRRLTSAGAKRSVKQRTAPGFGNRPILALVFFLHLS